MTEHTIPVLPENAELQYLGEGAANIVYRITIPNSQSQPRPGTPPPTELEVYSERTPEPSEIEFSDNDGSEGMEFEKKLLRVRKDLSTTLPCAVAQVSWKSLIEPLFLPSQLVTQSLVSLRGEGYNHISTLNNSLTVWEALSSSKSKAEKDESRPSKRRGVYLANDENGLLVTDMSGSDVVQFKPKWLSQSPSAPKNAKRCRQCALVARKSALARSKQSSHFDSKVKTEDEEGFCPLDLLSEDQEIVERVAGRILRQDISKDVIFQFAKWVQDTSLLRRLRDVQVQMDKWGCLVARGDEGGENQDLRVAMTVRDCSVFVKLGRSRGIEDRSLRGKEEEGEEVEARLGDLDLKSPDKLAYWQETERALIEEGWYTGTEIKGEKNTCSLGRAS